ncbi:uncharacterized protein LOC122238475 [Panthera tigris]|uniref:uncharacterized protein LOC122238475 n=1 Tax=Panthera tigris TaxID=9694 RepID=UPI001C6FB5E3|nr:uncharacterized protein LOC122238475 [Panthera tigris]
MRGRFEPVTSPRRARPWRRGHRAPSGNVPRSGPHGRPHSARHAGGHTPLSGVSFCGSSGARTQRAPSTVSPPDPGQYPSQDPCLAPRRCRSRSPLRSGQRVYSEGLHCSGCGFPEDLAWSRPQPSLLLPVRPSDLGAPCAPRAGDQSQSSVTVPSDFKEISNAEKREDQSSAGTQAIFLNNQIGQKRDRSLCRLEKCGCSGNCWGPFGLEGGSDGRGEQGEKPDVVRKKQLQCQ